MKPKGKNRLLAGALALFMALTSVSMVPVSAEGAAGGETAAPAGDPTYVLEGSDFEAVTEKGQFTDGYSVKAGTNEYFTVYHSKDMRFDGSPKTFADGYVGNRRINFSGTIDISVPKDAIEFTTQNPSTVKVWWVCGDAGRQLTVLDKSGETVYTTNETLEKNAMCISEFDLSQAGKFYFGSAEKGNYCFKLQVTEHAPKEYVLDTTTDLKAAAQGDFTDGQSAKAGTENYFTLFYSAKTKIDVSSKTFDDGYKGTQRVNFGGKLDAATPMNAISFTTSGASDVKVWWVEGDVDRQITVVSSKGETVYTSSETLAKNDPCISSFKISDAGTYFLGGDVGNNYFFKVSVTEGAPTEIVRGDWADVADPVITEAVQNEGKIDVTVSADIGTNGGDELVVTMTDKDGNESQLRSLAEKSEHTLSFTPSESGTYTFKAVLSREGETDKTSAEAQADYLLPLGVTNISSATNKGAGSVEIIWSPVKEADSYNVYANEEKVGTSEETAYTVTGLTVGEKYSFTVSAVRGGVEGKQSDPMEATVTEEEQQLWGFTIYGTSTSTTDGSNGYEGSINEDGKVTVFSENGKGKIQPAGQDGIAFYYTPISTDLNFTVRANVHVDKWTYSNGQDGFGLLAIDSIPEVYGAKDFWSNQYMALASKVEYRYDPEFAEVTYDNTLGNKYSMQLGLGINTKLGITPENIDKVMASDTATIKQVANGIQYPLELSAAEQGLDAGTYNIIGNVTNPEALKGDSIAELTDFVMEIRRNNTGYFVSYYSQDGELIRTQKFYDPEALDQLDAENVYVGFFASRNARATFSDVQVTTVAPEDDDPAEEKPVEGITPRINIKSGNVSNSESYTLTLFANVAGTAEISVNGVKDSEIELQANTNTNTVVKLTQSGVNKITVVFTPDPDQELGEDQVLASTDPVTKEHNVTFENRFANQTNLYISPNGSAKGNGGPEYPLDVYTAVNVAQPGQIIVVMEGTYKLESPVHIARGLNGSADKPIYMIADPEAAARPVFDFQKVSQGFRAGGDYWYFSGFDVTNTSNGNGGFYVNGNHITLDQINAYNNGNTGIQISAYNNSSDPKELWPCDNLILNCTSHNNADGGYEDADGFAAKLTVGTGNRFEGCIAYNNADDGWDLFAKTASGSIGAVTIKNSVAYGNGYLEDGTNAGNGNGFKLGGEGLAGGHMLVNCIAFGNKADGITSNSCPDVKVINCTTYNNQKSNINLYTRDSVTATDFTVKGLISFKHLSQARAAAEISAIDYAVPDVFNIKNQDPISGSDIFVWNGSSSVNSEGAAITENDFISLVLEGEVERNEDGTINMNDYLVLGESAPADSGARFDDEGENKPIPSPELPEIKPDENLPDVPGDNPGTDTPVTLPSGSFTVPETTTQAVTEAPVTEAPVTEAPENTEAPSTAAPDTEAPEVTSPTPDETNGDSAANDTTAPVNTGNANEENVGNTNDGNGSDKNQPTGVPLTVVPAALAAIVLGGSIIAKKRK